MKNFFTKEQLIAKLKRHGYPTPSEGELFYSDKGLQYWMFVSTNHVHILVDTLANETPKLRKYRVHQIVAFEKETAARFRMMPDGFNLRHFYFVDTENEKTYSFEYTHDGYNKVWKLYQNF